MNFFKMLFAVVGATVLLGALVSSASAGRLSNSGTTINATWTTMRFSGGIGTWECEVILNGTLDSRSLTKTSGTLMGFITAGSVNRCARGGETILRETLPWHIRYVSFAGTLPAISSIRTIALGFSFRIREPTFGIECLSRSRVEEPAGLVYNLNGSGVMTSATVGGTIRCGSFTGTLSGTSSSITAVTVTLI